jgi:hypothetical protein
MINKDDIEIINYDFDKQDLRVRIKYRYKGIVDIVDFSITDNGVNIYSDALYKKYEKEEEKELVIAIIDKAMAIGI